MEDCGDVVGLDEIDFHFGAAVRRIVEGETKFRCDDALRARSTSFPPRACVRGRD